MYLEDLWFYQISSPLTFSRFLPTVDGSGNKEYFYLGLFRQLDKKFFILFNGKDKVRDWLGFTKNFSLRGKGKTFQVQWL